MIAKERIFENCIFEDWGLIDYEAALEKQAKYVEIVAGNEDHSGFLIFCSHPAVVTTGRQTKADDVFSWTGSIVEVSRGGRATYHGPSQEVIYPIMNLKKPRHGRVLQDVRGFIRALESTIIQTLKEYGLESHGKTTTALENSLEDTGVWIGEQKIASIGIAVRKWVTFHGAAVNVDWDPEAFQGLNPCGYKSSVMTNLEHCLQHKINRTAFKEKLKSHCLSLL